MQPAHAPTPSTTAVQPPKVLSVRSSQELGEYLRSRGIPWHSASSRTDEESADVSLQAAMETVASRLLQTSGNAEIDGPPASPRVADTQARVPAEPKPLPPLEQVTLKLAGDPGDWKPRESGNRLGSRNRSGDWTPPTAADQARARAVGKRAEELIFEQERIRVRALGCDEARVIWVSQTDEGADHDIRSVDPDGEDIWIEVKGTSGSDGRFMWSATEFARAVRKRDRYVLWRVYEADASEPRARAFRDPIGLLLDGRLGMTVANLAAEVAPATAP